MPAFAPPKASTIIWAVANVAGIGIWLLFVRELWHHTEEQRCPDFGDSIQFIVSLFPLVAVIGLNTLGLFRAGKNRTDAASGRGTVVVHAGLVAAWLLAAIFAYVKIRIDMASPCTL